MFKIINHSKAQFFENFTDIMRPVLGQVSQKTDDDLCVAGLLGSALRSNTCVWVKTEVWPKTKKLNCSTVLIKVLINPTDSDGPLDLSPVEERRRGFSMLYYLTLKEGCPWERV